MNENATVPRPAAQVSGAAGDGALRCWLLALACALAAAGMKIWLIRAYGTPLPFWDQWAEAMDVYQPALAGALDPLRWFAFHNEHRIFLTRVTAYALFAATGRWDPILQMLFNALLHCATLGWLAFVLARTLRARSAAAFALLAAALALVPFAWENALWGFQAQFCYLILLSLACVYLSCGAPAFSGRWLAGLCVGLLCYLAMASGAVTLLAAGAVALAQVASGSRRGRAELFAVALQGAVSLALVLDVAWHSAPSGALSAGGVVTGIALMAGWPATAAPLPAVMVLVSALLIQAPLACLLVSLLRERAPLTDTRWLPVAIGAWVGAQIVVIAFGRSGSLVLASRYLDILVVGVIANAACLFGLLERARARAVAAAIVWLLAVVLGSAKASATIASDVALRRSSSLTQMENLRGYFASNDFERLKSIPHFGLPFPAAEPLRGVLTDAAIRRILPEELSGVPAPRALAILKKNVLGLGPSLIALALLLYCLAQLRLGRPRGGVKG
jgi:hypothetical protein